MMALGSARSRSVDTTRDMIVELACVRDNLNLQVRHRSDLNWMKLNPWLDFQHEG